MTNDSAPHRKGRVFYGYYLLAVTFLFLLLFNGSGIWVFSLFVKPLEESLGWGRGQVMAGFTIYYAMVGIASPLVGRFVDRYGARRVISVGAVMMGFGFLLVSRMSDLYLFYLGYVIIGAGAAAIGPVPCSAIISNWFLRKRGLALGLMSAGIGAGGVVMAPFIGYVLSHYDWRAAYLSLAVAVVAVTIPLALGLVRMRPSEMGLYPDGDDAPAEDAGGPRQTVGNRASFTLKQALRTRAFWFIAISFACYGFGSMGAQQASVPFLDDMGYPIATAAAALGTIGLGSTVGKVLFGRLCDKIQANYAFAIGVGLRLAGVLVLLTVRADSSQAVIWTYALLLGLGAGAWLPTLSMLASTRFGLLHYGAVFGALNICMSLGISSGPFVSGLMHDATGSYFLAFTIFAALLFLAIPAILLVGRPQHPRSAYKKSRP
ncbi:MFS transporter [Chloroflexota bacterium]